MKAGTKSIGEFEKFDSTVDKILSVSRKELKERERKWKKQRTRRKLAKA